MAATGGSQNLGELVEGRLVQVGAFETMRVPSVEIRIVGLLDLFHGSSYQLELLALAP